MPSPRLSSRISKIGAEVPFSTLFTAALRINALASLVDAVFPASGVRHGPSSTPQLCESAHKLRAGAGAGKAGLFEPLPSELVD
jgi:hypothetical protein